MISHTSFASPYGPLMIGWEDESILFIGPYLEDVPCVPPSGPAIAAMAQLDEYFRGQRSCFDLPFLLIGTEFQKSVWNYLIRIPYGQVRSYGQIAAAIGSPKAARAVGSACNRNPLWILIPCHRVVDKNGSLTGYAGGLTMKQALLDLEKLHKTSPEAP